MCAHFEQVKFALGQADTQIDGDGFVLLEEDDAQRLNAEPIVFANRDLTPEESQKRRKDDFMAACHRAISLYDPTYTADQVTGYAKLFHETLTLIKITK